MKIYYTLALGLAISAFFASKADAQPPLPDTCQVNFMADNSCNLPTTLRLDADFGFYQIDWYYNGTLVHSDTAHWNPNGKGKLAAGGNGRGTALNQFKAGDVLVDDSGYLYIADNYRNNTDTNDRILKWFPGDAAGTIIADGWRSPLSSRFHSSGIAFNYPDYNTIYISDPDQARVLKWQLGANTGIVYAGDHGNGSGANQFSTSMNGICFDPADTLFVVDAFNSRIQKWAPGAISGTTLATGLGNPQFVASDLDGSIYVTDFNNSRVLRYDQGSNTPVTVAGDPYGTGGFGAGQLGDSFLNHPEGVYVDGLKNLYISDFSNYRVQFWPNGSKVGITIGGEGGNPGGSDSQVVFTTGITQDRWGNVFVGVTHNLSSAPYHRVMEYSPQIVDTFQATQKGVYKVVVRSYTGCVITDSITVNPGVQVQPVINVSGFTLGVTAAYLYKTYQWLLDGQSISGATDSLYQVKANGGYRVVVTDEDGCTDTSDVYTINNYTGIEGVNALAKQVTIYPNPVEDVLHIRAPFQVNVTIISLEGKVLKQAGNVHQVSIKELASGMYFLQISDKEGRILKTEKFIKSGQ